MVRNSGLLVLTVLLRVTGTLMLLGGVVAVIMGFADIVRHELNYVRVPTKPAMHSNLKPAGYSDRKPATLGVNRMGRFDDVVGG